MNKLAWQTAVVAMAVALAAPSLRAASRPLSEGAQQGEVRQQQIRMQTQRAAEELGTIIAEFEANGLGDSADVKVLQAIREVLGKLSQDQMEKVAALLAAARQEKNAGAAQRNVAEAFAGQKNIVVELQQLILEYQRQQELAAIALRFNQLADRQNANLKMLRTYRRIAGNTNLANLNETQKTLLQLQITEQAAIRQEVDRQLDKLQSLAQTVAPAAAERLGQVLTQARDGKLVDILADAVTELSANHAGLAATRQRTGRDQLRDLARLVAPESDPVSLLRTSAETLARLSRQQQALVEGAAELTDDAGQFADKAAQLEEQQGDLVDDTDQIRKDLADVAADAVNDLAAAQLKMQRVRKALNDRQKAAIQEQASAARQNIEAARAKVVAALARLEKLANVPDALAQAAALKEGVDTLIRDQDKLAGDTAGQKEVKALADLAVRQNALQGTAKELQRPAAAAAPEASKALSMAAEQMAHAAQALTAQLNAADAAAAQQQALAALQQARQTLDARTTQLQQAETALNQTRQAQNALAGAIEGQQQVAAAAQRQAAQQVRPPASQPATSPAQSSVSRQQQNVAKTTQELQRQVESTAPEASPALTEARQRMDNAQRALDKPDPAAAASAARQALAGLQEAKNKLDQKAADLEKRLGRAPDPSPQLEKVAQALEKARQDLREATDSNQQKIADLQRRQQQISQDLKTFPRQDQAADQPLGQAQKAAEQAARQLGRNDLKAASQSMGQALDALRNAMTSTSQTSALPSEKTPGASSGSQAGTNDLGHSTPRPDADLARSQQADGSAADQPKSEPGAAAQAGGPSLAELAKRQDALRQKLAGLQAADSSNVPSDDPGQSAARQTDAAPAEGGEKESAAASGRQSAAPSADQMAQIAADLTKVAAEDPGTLPVQARQAMGQAEQALSESAAQASAQNAAAAQKNAQQADQAIARAQASLAAQQQALAQAVGQNPGQPPGTAQAQMSAQNPGAQPGRQQANGLPAAPGPVNENTPGQGDGNRQDDRANADSTPAGRLPLDAAGAFVGLPPRDRAAIQQSRNDRYPEEYGPMVEQYLKNLSEQGK